MAYTAASWSRNFMKPHPFVAPSGVAVMMCSAICDASFVSEIASDDACSEAPAGSIVGDRAGERTFDRTRLYVLNG